MSIVGCCPKTPIDVARAGRQQPQTDTKNPLQPMRSQDQMNYIFLDRAVSYQHFTGTASHDYGVFEKIRGPGGNTIVVISGTRDAGVTQTAEAFTSAPKLKELEQKNDVRLPVEALLEVSAVNGVNLNGKLLAQSNRDLK